MRRLVLLLAVAAVPAWAADAAAGASLFNNSCASCHQARSPDSHEKVKSGKQPADLARLAQEKPEVLNAWVLNPKVRAARDTACDLAGLTAEELPSLYAYLRAQAVPPVPRAKRRQAELELSRAARTKSISEKKKGAHP